jgi:hypothetical protein
MKIKFDVSIKLTDSKKRKKKIRKKSFVRNDVSTIMWN